MTNRSLRAWGVPFAALIAATGCAGDLDDPSRFLEPQDGSVVDLGQRDGGSADAGDSGPPCPDVVATLLSSSQAPSGCAQASCHSAGARAQGLDLEGPNLIARLSTQMSACGSRLQVDPTDPERSLLYVKLGPPPYPCTGARMPLAGPPLTSLERQCVLEYIRSQVPRPDAGTTDSGPSDAGVDTGPRTGGQDGGPRDLGAASGDSGASADAGSSVLAAFEAESMMLTAPFEIVQDSSASGGRYVTQTSGALNADADSPTAGRAVFSFSSSQAGTVYAFARVRAAAPESDSFWVRLRGADWFRWNELSTSSMGNWVWQRIEQGGTPPSWTVSAGMQTFEIAFREANAQIDRIVITLDPLFTPPP